MVRSRASLFNLRIFGTCTVSTLIKFWMHMWLHNAVSRTHQKGVALHFSSSLHGFARLHLSIWVTLEHTGRYMVYEGYSICGKWLCVCYVHLFQWHTWWLWGSSDIAAGYRPTSGVPTSSGWRLDPYPVRSWATTQMDKKVKRSKSVMHTSTHPQCVTEPLSS